VREFSIYKNRDRRIHTAGAIKHIALHAGELVDCFAAIILGFWKRIEQQARIL
jgi:hypothetical protein